VQISCYTSISKESYTKATKILWSFEARLSAPWEPGPPSSRKKGYEGPESHRLGAIAIGGTGSTLTKGPCGQERSAQVKRASFEEKEPAGRVFTAPRVGYLPRRPDDSMRSSRAVRLPVKCYDYGGGVCSGGAGNGPGGRSTRATSCHSAIDVGSGPHQTSRPSNPGSGSYNPRLAQEETPGEWKSRGSMEAVPGPFKRGEGDPGVR